MRLAQARRIAGGEYLHVFVDDEQREIALHLHPEFLDELLWGGKVRGLRVALAAPGLRHPRRR
jgi:hypothetical protein